MTGTAMVVMLMDDQFRNGLVADVLCIHAPRMEGTARRSPVWRRGLTTDDREALHRRPIETRQRTQEAQSVGHRRAIEELIDGTLFDGPARIHHHDSVRV